MKKAHHLKSAVALGAAVSLITGCTTVVRENIISSVNTGIGLSLAENPKTEMYEAKLGYIRSQFYSVPTGKTVAKDRKAGPGQHELSNHAENTPELVSGIKMNSDFRHLVLGATVAENFAVGKIAVMSPAAVAMYVANAPSKENAEAAAKATSGLSKLGADSGTASVETMDGVVTFITALPAGDYPKKSEVLESFTTVGDLVPKWDFDRYSWDSANTIVHINDPTKQALPAGYDRFKTYRDTLKNSIEVLKAMSADPNIANIKVRIAGAPAAAPAPQITDAQKIQVGKALAEQKSKLEKLDKDFAQHPAVRKTLEYFVSIVKS